MSTAFPSAPWNVEARTFTAGPFFTGLAPAPARFATTTKPKHKMEIYEVAVTQSKEVNGKKKTETFLEISSVTARSELEAAFKAGYQLEIEDEEDYDVRVRKF